MPRTRPAPHQGPEIAPTLELYAVADLKEDPANLRLHDDENLDDIEASLRRFGQQDPLIVDGDGIVRAGNARLRVARDRLGWTHVVCLRTALTGPDAVAFAIAHNKTPLRGKWDDPALARTLEAIRSAGLPLAATGFRDAEFDALMAKLAAKPEAPEPAATGEQDLGERWMVIVGCDSERQQVALLARLQAEGFLDCKAIVA